MEKINIFQSVLKTLKSSINLEKIKHSLPDLNYMAKYVPGHLIF